MSTKPGAWFRWLLLQAGLESCPENRAGMHAGRIGWAAVRKVEGCEVFVVEAVMRAARIVQDMEDIVLTRSLHISRLSVLTCQR